MSSITVDFIYTAYFVVLIYTLIRILLDTKSTSKTLAYLLIVIALPLVGFLFYFSFGINYRKKHSHQKIKETYRNLSLKIKDVIPDETEKLIASHQETLGHFTPMVHFNKGLGNENLSANNFQLLTNGEEKFPEILRVLGTAQHHIHMEYYAWENDVRGNQIKDVLLKKASEGVTVRVLYDAYASRKIKHNIVKALATGGVEIHPVIKVKLAGLANKINHRDHRKVLIVDGKTGFVGGINLSDRYDNSIDTGLFWRDTHVKITGPGVMNLQRHFNVNWDAFQPNPIEITSEIYPNFQVEKSEHTQLSQIMAGGPVYPMANVMLTYSKIFSLATKKLYITNPYFIPNDTILDTLKQSAISDVDVRLILPKKSDSAIVGAAAKFYFTELLEAGVKIFLYKKGFVHAKTMTADGMVSIVGTANMDIRSFDLNFEIMSIIYGKEFAAQMEARYLSDLKECDELNYEDWQKQSVLKKLTYAAARLVSSFL